MTVYRLEANYEPRINLSDRAKMVCRMFGISSVRLNQNRLRLQCKVDLDAGQIIYFSGPSGAGKSTLLNRLTSQLPQEDTIDVFSINLPEDRSVIDCFDLPVLDSLRLLSSAGLSDCFCVLKTPAQLSSGQQWRFRLAVSLAAGKKFIVADEFCSGLDRITASVIACRLRCLSRQRKVTFILASAHDDLLADLLPDSVIAVRLSGQISVIYREIE